MEKITKESRLKDILLELGGVVSIPPSEANEAPGTKRTFWFSCPYYVRAHKDYLLRPWGRNLWDPGFTSCGRMTRERVIGYLKSYLDYEGHHEKVKVTRVRVAVFKRPKKLPSEIRPVNIFEVNGYLYDITQGTCKPRIDLSRP